VGRDYDTIHRTSSVNCYIGETEAEAVAKLPEDMRGNLEQARRQALIGTPAQIRERLADYEEAGVQELIVYFADATRLDPLRLFSQECID